MTAGHDGSREHIGGDDVVFDDSHLVELEGLQLAPEPTGDADSRERAAGIGVDDGAARASDHARGSEQ